MFKSLEDFKNQIKSEKVTVVGIGISNTPLIKKLVEYGAVVTACDEKEKDKISQVAEELENIGVTLKLGKDYLSNLDAKVIFKTPGMRFDVPELLEAKKKGSIITSEMEVFFDVCKAPIIAVTGSDGKTTTTTLIYQMLMSEGVLCHLGGNIGKPLLPEIEQINDTDKVILELSSFQLHTMKKSPSIAVITNITPNHLDKHKSMEEYVEAKCNVYRHQTNDQKLILNYDNALTNQIGKTATQNVIYFSRNEDSQQGVHLIDDVIYYNDIKVLACCDIKIPGLHNVENYMAAIAAVWGMVSIQTINKVAKTFGGVEHRIEFVREIGGVRYYNDSIASSPTRSIAGLVSFDCPIVMIAGGRDKKVSFDVLAKVIVKNVKKLVLTGEAKDKIRKEVYLIDKNYPVVMTESFLEAVEAARDLAQPGDVVILSPACTSFDMFNNFEERGKRFKEIVNNMEE